MQIALGCLKTWKTCTVLTSRFKTSCFFLMYENVNCCSNKTRLCSSSKLLKRITMQNGQWSLCIWFPWLWNLRQRSLTSLIYCCSSRWKNLPSIWRWSSFNFIWKSWSSKGRKKMPLSSLSLNNLFGQTSKRARNFKRSFTTSQTIKYSV